MDSMWYNQSILSVFGKFFKDNVLEVFEHLNEDDVQKLIKLKDSREMNCIFSAAICGNARFLNAIFQTQVFE